MSLVGESKCPHAKQGTLRFTNIHHTLFPSVITISHDETNLPAAPLSTFSLPLTLSCSQTQWLHVKVRGSENEDSGAEKSTHIEHTNFRPICLQPLHCPECGATVSFSALLAPDPSPMSIGTVAWVGWLSWMQQQRNPSRCIAQNFTIQKERSEKGEFLINCFFSLLCHQNSPLVLSNNYRGK